MAPSPNLPPFSTVQIEPSWGAQLSSQFQQPYFADLVAFLKQERSQGQVIYPPGGLIFNAFALTPFDAVKVLLLGQDPYHGPGQAHGLCFSVPQGIKPPPSLVNIFKEIHTDLGILPTKHGNLEAWARQGVLLLNATLTVRASQAGSHQGRGWETFTDAVISQVAQQHEHRVFMLWGKYAQQKAALIDTSRHLVLQSPHPSPFSADKGFFGCRHFSKANDYLKLHGATPVDWQV